MNEALIDLVVEEAGWRDALPEFESLAERAGALAIEAVALDPAQWTICLLATDDARIARLNRQFRGKAGATNVLSWPAFDLAPERPGGAPKRPKPAFDGRRTSLGDVAVALQTLRREAEIAAIPLKDHAIHLILHGCLHLLGFDHLSDEDAALMERIETQALARIGVADPYLRGDPGQGVLD